jgi:hypothetical protein
MGRKATRPPVGQREPLEIRYADPRTLNLNEQNPRWMPPEEMAALKRSIETWGMVDPVIVRREDGLVIGGHQRIAAAIELGLAQVPVVDVEISGMDAALLGQALNRIMGRWDEPTLSIVQQQLRLQGADLTLTGFTQAELDVFAGTVAGAPVHSAARQNGNFNAFNRGTGEYTRLECGEIMVALPSDVYRRLLAWARSEHPEDDRAAMVAVLTAGLNALGAPEAPPAPAPESAAEAEGA